MATKLRGPRPQIPVPLGLELSVQGSTKATKGAPKAVSFQPMIAPETLQTVRTLQRLQRRLCGCRCRYQCCWCWSCHILCQRAQQTAVQTPDRSHEEVAPHLEYLGLSPLGLAISFLSYRDPSVGTRGSISSFDSSIIQLYLQCSKNNPPPLATAYTILLMRFLTCSRTG
jgi:hypothetical protein